MHDAPAWFDEIDTPALVVDLDVLEANIERMQSFFADKRAKLRPHFKTHKCTEIALMQLAVGAKGITAAKLGEAEVLVEAGVRDILIANQIVGAGKILRLVELAHRAELTVAVDCPKNVAEISKAAKAAGVRLSALVELDIGMARCGVRTLEDAVSLARIVEESECVEFAGLQGYEGHLVLAEPGTEKEAGLADALTKLECAKRRMESVGLTCREVSGGGTGTYRTTGVHPVMTEIQAGSYATMDTRYCRLVEEFSQALFCLVTIVSRPEPNVAIADAGLKSLTGEFGLPSLVGCEGLELVKLSEEHSAFAVSGEAEKLEVGDRVLLAPSHGCTTINLHDFLYGVRGGRLECRWEVSARGRSA